MNLKALLVGINEYGGDNKLYGCVNDVLISRDILRIKHGVLEQDIRMLVDARATKDAIMERLEWLISQSKTTKQLFFHYSGHGAQVPNTNYADDAELDSLDEVMCPFDFSWVTNTWISDDDINNLLKKKDKSCRLVMIFDCCHSGTVYRTAMNASDQLYKAKAKAISMPLDMLSRIPRFDVTEAVEIKNEGDRFWGFDNASTKATEKLPIKQKSALFTPNTIVLSACNDYQTAADANFKTRYQGAFSYCLQKFMYKNPEFSVREVEESTVRYMKSFGFSQNPEFSVSKDTFARKLIING